MLTQNILYIQMIHNLFQLLARSRPYRTAPGAPVCENSPPQTPVAVDDAVPLRHQKRHSAVVVHNASQQRCTSARDEYINMIATEVCR